MPDSVRHCSIASQTGRTSWKPGPNPIDSAEHSTVRRKEQRQQRSKAVEMTARGKHGKPTAGFPPFPQALEIPQHRRDSHIPTASAASPYIKVRKKPVRKPSTQGGPD